MDKTQEILQMFHPTMAQILSAWNASNAKAPWLTSRFSGAQVSLKFTGFVPWFGHIFIKFTREINIDPAIQRGLEDYVP